MSILREQCSLCACSEFTATTVSVTINQRTGQIWDNRNHSWCDCEHRSNDHEPSVMLLPFLWVRGWPGRIHRWFKEPLVTAHGHAIFNRYLFLTGPFTILYLIGLITSSSNFQMTAGNSTHTISTGMTVLVQAFIVMTILATSSPLVYSVVSLIAKILGKIFGVLGKLFKILFKLAAVALAVLIVIFIAQHA